MWAEMLADAMAVRIAFENKIGMSVDGKKRENAPSVDPEVFAGPLADYAQTEEFLRKGMVDCYRVTVPGGIRRWQEETPGIGESTLARLLGVTGDPRIAYPMHWEGEKEERHLVTGEPYERSIGQLWQYCGHGAVKNRNVKGDAPALMANGRPDAKKLVWMMAQAQVKTTSKAGGGYRWMYDATKAKYAEKVHSKDCTGGYSGPLYVKCKTHVLTADELAAGKEAVQRQGGDDKVKVSYALAGDPYQPSHVHAIALRHTGKEILRDLWLATRDELEPVG
jgi:hypothetical protein